MEQIKSGENLELEVGSIITINLQDLRFFDILPTENNEKFSMNKFQSCYWIRNVFNNSNLRKEIPVERNWITLLCYQGNGTFTEYYTGINVFSLPEELIASSNVEEFINLQNFLENRQLFFDLNDKHLFDFSAKEQICSQVDVLPEIYSAIIEAKIMLVENFESKTDYKTGELISFDLPYAYEEDEIYNFEHGISLSRERKKDAE